MHQLLRFLLLKQLQSDQLTFFLDHHPHQPLVQQALYSLKKIVIGSIFGGLSLSLSLRRYMPNVFGQFSTRRMMIEFALTSSVFLVGYFIGLSSVNFQLAPMKKRLLFECDSQYIALLRNLYYKGEFKNEQNLLKGFLQQKDIKTWHKKGNRLIVEKEVELDIGSN